jgi:hypothetical protein
MNLLNLENYESVGTALGLLFNVLMALAINLDCRAKNIKARKSFTILSLLFPIIVGIIYAVKRKGLQKEFKFCATCKNKVDAYANKCPFCGGYTLYEFKNPKAKTFQKISIVLCVVSIICGVVSTVIDAPSYVKNFQKNVNSYSDNDYEEYEDDIDSDYSELSYDRNHIAYSNPYDVLFYDKDGNSYVSDENEAYFDNTDTNETYETKYCFVDGDGYFCYINDGSLSPLDDDPYAYIYYDEDDNAKVINATYANKDGNRYYLAKYVSWTYSGSLCVNGETVE